MSLFIGGGQAYYSRTAERDQRVVKRVAELLTSTLPKIQVVTGGTAGIPDDFAKNYDRVVDIVSSEFLEAYKERTADSPRSYWVAGKTQEHRRLAFLTNPDICVGLFIQGGMYTTHEMKLFQESGRALVVFTGSGGASGGNFPYEGWAYKLPQDSPARAYHSTDPDADVNLIAHHLAEDVLFHLRRK